MSKHDEVRSIRKPYRKPRLEVLGDLRTFTLGSSIGASDSGLQDAWPNSPIPLPGLPNPDGSPPWSKP